MVQVSTILMGSLLFVGGLILGLVCQLPGISSPGDDATLTRHPRDVNNRNNHSGRAAATEDSDASGVLVWRSSESSGVSDNVHGPKYDVNDGKVLSDKQSSSKNIIKNNNGNNNNIDNVFVSDIDMQAEISPADVVDIVGGDQSWRRSQTTGVVGGGESGGSRQEHLGVPLSGSAPLVSVNTNHEIPSPGNKERGQKGRPGDISRPPASSPRLADLVNPAQKIPVAPPAQTVHVQIAATSQLGPKGAASSPPAGQRERNVTPAPTKTHDKAKENMANYITAGDPQNHTSADANSLTQVVDGPYWSSWADSLVPAGFGPQQTDDWRHKLATSQIVGVSEGCGRMQNRKLTLSDASQACARYRLNTDQIQGEIYSYYLSQVLGIQHVPPSVLVTTDSREERWRRVNKAVTDARWAADKVAIVTPWIGGLEPAYIPQALRHHDRHLHPSDVTKRTDLSQDAVRDLVQWSDLIVFDYLTANLDRVVNNMYNQQWNSEMMNSPAHNLERDPDTGLLVFMDNESGLFHSYRLLDKYGSYHQALLSSLCVFRRDTAQRVRALHDQGQGRLGALIMEAFREHEPLHKHVPKLPERTAAVLDQRLSDVYRQIQHCEGLYGS